MFCTDLCHWADPYLRAWLQGGLCPPSEAVSFPQRSPGILSSFQGVQATLLPPLEKHSPNLQPKTSDTRHEDYIQVGKEFSAPGTGKNQALRHVRPLYRWEMAKRHSALGQKRSLYA